MSETAPKGIYVYQPFGSVTHPDKAALGRLYGLGGLPDGARCDGLTKDEAEVFAETLNDICWMRDECASCGHRSRFQFSHCSSCGEAAAPPWVRP